MTTPLIEAMARKLCASEDDVPSHWDDYSSLSQAALAAITEAGYAVVPIEPTEAMEEAARDVPFIAMGNGDYLEPDRSDIYRAMIQAGKAKP